MRKLGFMVALVVLVAGTVAYAQTGPPRPAGGQRTGQGPGSGGVSSWGGMSAAEVEKMRAQMVDRMLDQAGLTAKEKTAAKKALAAKAKAREQLQAAHGKLMAVVSKAKVSNGELQRAMTAYRAAQTRYEAAIVAIDKALVKQLSVKSQAKCLAFGILDNGLSFGGRGMGRQGGGPGAGGRPAGAPAGRLPG